MLHLIPRKEAKEGFKSPWSRGPPPHRSTNLFKMKRRLVTLSCFTYRQTRRKEIPADRENFAGWITLTMVLSVSPVGFIKSGSSRIVCRTDWHEQYGLCRACRNKLIKRTSAFESRVSLSISCEYPRIS